jgi:light-regulated signal transduction histidine kinase (bacteriophytochrome)
LLVQTMIRRAQRAESSEAFCAAVADEVREVTGFDRVMVYRFTQDGSGEVIAESRAAGAESFMGQRFPESDIPRQARALYKANWIRLIPDARYAPAPIIPPINPMDGRPLDLTQSVLRSVSPVHRQYLANMGVVASMSLSIMVRGQLWGLIACHHPAPRYLPFRLRDACELFAEMTSAHLEKKVAAEEYEARLQATRTHEELVNRLAQESDLAEGLMRLRPNLRDLIPAGGIGLWIDGRFTGDGAMPPQAWVEDLVGWLNEHAGEGVYQADCLPLLYPPAERFADVASGVLALSVSRSPRDYLLWFRPELIRTITWAGNPTKALGQASGTEILTPRHSFAAWREEVKLHAAPWLPMEVEAAHRLRVSLLEVVLRRIDQIAREREIARLQQERLTAELDRRVEQWQSLAGVLRQETDRRAQAEAELSQVLRRTVEDQEAERLRIARELHDTLGQSLTLLQLGLEAIGRERPSVPELQQRIVALKALAGTVGRDANRLAWEIRPTALDDLGIQTAIRNLLETWSEHSKIQFDLHLRLEERRLSPMIETTLYRVLQEALTNVVRHAAATRVGVILRAADNQVTMIVEDDGRGFGADDPDQADGPHGQRSKRLGLLGMRERLALVGGSLEVESAPGDGTTLFVRVPV